MKKTSKKQLKVIELFAGVGGFRIGLEDQPNKPFKIVWSSQWEPGSKVQYASDTYVRVFGSKGHSNEDISTVAVKDIPEHDVLVGGFPCQDYSVARTLNQAKGLLGKKGVLWWQIHRILTEKKKKPSYLILENVDRLLKSPASHRGRDFAVMLASLSDLGYVVEWRIINAADYGMPQRRRRIFIVGYYKGTSIYERLKKQKDLTNWLLKDGVLAEGFPIIRDANELFITPKKLEGELADITDKFNKTNPKVSVFEKAGVMLDRFYWTTNVKPNYQGKRTLLSDLLEDEKFIPKEFFIDPKDLPKWKHQKGAKAIERISKKTGHKYKYSEGAMAFPDSLDMPGRTIITGEGGKTPSRFKHVVKTKSGRYRRLVPLELERMNMFPDDHTKGIPDIKRAFIMGNALVVGVVKKIGNVLVKKISE